MVLCSQKLFAQKFKHTGTYTTPSSINWTFCLSLMSKSSYEKFDKPPERYFSSHRPVFERFEYLIIWVAKSSNHSKPICAPNQRVPWASPKHLKPHSTINYWALTSTSKKVFSLPPPLYPEISHLTIMTVDLWP
jgi:hypothetical protein